MYRIINIATFITFMFVLSPASATFIPHFFGDTAFAKSAFLALTLALFLIADPDVDHFGLLSNERRLCQLLAAPVLAIGLFHLAIGNFHQAKNDFDFTGFLVFFSAVFAWIDSILPDPPPETPESEEHSEEQ